MLRTCRAVFPSKDKNKPSKWQQRRYTCTYITPEQERYAKSDSFQIKKA